MYVDKIGYDIYK